MPQFPTYTVRANMESIISTKGSVRRPYGQALIRPLACPEKTFPGCQLEQLAEINTMIYPECQTTGLFQKECLEKI